MFSRSRKILSRPVRASPSVSRSAERASLRFWCCRSTRCCPQSSRPKSSTRRQTGLERCAYVCVYLSIYIYLSVCAYIYIFINIYILAAALRAPGQNLRPGAKRGQKGAYRYNVHIYINVYIYIFSWAYIYIYMHICKYIYTRSCPQSSRPKSSTRRQTGPETCL